MTIPMGYFNLEDNMIIQNGGNRRLSSTPVICELTTGSVAFFVIILVVLEWMVQFFANGLVLERVPFVGDNQSQVLGTIIFNYAFVVTVPSWVNEKRESVSINKSIWYAYSNTCPAPRADRVKGIHVVFHFHFYHPWSLWGVGFRLPQRW